MVGTGNPEGLVALHTSPADQQILDGDKHRVAKVELTGHVGGWNSDHKGGMGRIRTGCEEVRGFPPGVEAALNLLVFVGLIHFGRAAWGVAGHESEPRLENSQVV